MIRPVVSLERPAFLEPEGKVGYRRGRDGEGQETMDYLKFIARVSSHIPDKGQVMVRYYGLYSNAYRGKSRKSGDPALRVIREKLRPVPSKSWAALIRKPHIGLRSAAMIRKVYEVDPMICPKCGNRMKIVAFLTAHVVVDRIIDHLKLSFPAERPPPERALQDLLMVADPPVDYFS